RLEHPVARQQGRRQRRYEKERRGGEAQVGRFHLRECARRTARRPKALAAMWRATGARMWPVPRRTAASTPPPTVVPATPSATALPSVFQSECPFALASWWL